MNKLIPLISAAVFAGAIPLLMADDAHHPKTEQTPAPAAAAQSDTTSGASNHMQEQMQKMQAQMDKIRQAKTSKERSALLHEHMQSMREGMKMMREMPAMAARSPTEKSGKETTPVIRPDDGRRHDGGRHASDDGRRHDAAHGHDGEDDGSDGTAYGCHAGALSEDEVRARGVCHDT